MNPIEQYISEQRPEIQTQLRQVWDCITSVLPDAEQRISWSMPTFKKKNNIIHFAAAKHHIGVYPGPETIEAFRERLKKFKTSKGAVQLPLDKELPLDLIADMARWSYLNKVENSK